MFNLFSIDYISIGPSYESPIHFTQLDVGLSGVWAVSNKNNVYYRAGTYGDSKVSVSFWENVPGRYLKWVTSGNNVVIGITTANTVCYRSGITASNPVGDQWNDYGEKRLVRIDVDENGRLIGVDKSNIIFTSQFTIPPSSWSQKSGYASTVTVGHMGFWVLNDDMMLWYWDGQWRSGDSSLNLVTASAARNSNSIWAVDKDGLILKGSGPRDSLTWTDISSGWSYVSAGGNDHVWSLDDNGYTYRWDGTSFHSVEGRVKVNNDFLIKVWF